MSKRLKIFLFLVIMPFLFVVIINENPLVPNRTSKYNQDYCTWYCHNVTCLHFKMSYNNNSTVFKETNKKIFDLYVNSLHGNLLGLNYRNINLLIFIILIPLIASLLVWNLIRKLK